jgi:hypothetical protein
MELVDGVLYYCHRLDIDLWVLLMYILAYSVSTILRSSKLILILFQYVLLVWLVSVIGSMLTVFHTSHKHQYSKDFHASLNFGDGKEPMGM